MDAYITGGRLGDAVHALYVIKEKYMSTGRIGDLYLSLNFEKYGGDKFNFPIEVTQYELQEFLFQCCPYIHKVYILEEDESNLDLEKYHEVINLNNWRNFRPGSRDWLTLLQDAYDITYNIHPWFYPSPLWFMRPNSKPYVAIHKSIHRTNYKFPWMEILEHYKAKGYDVFFVSSTPEVEYEYFLCKDHVFLHHCHSIIEMAYWIYHSEVFIGNLSSPLAMSTAFGKTSIIEMPNDDWLSAISYLNSRLCRGQLYWFISNKKKRLPKDINIP
jgi:hypothetical protein